MRKKDTAIEEMKKEIERLNSKIDKNSEIMKDYIDAKTQDLQENLIQFKDDILYEIKAMREEFAIITGWKDHIEDHETRILKIERKIRN